MCMKYSSRVLALIVGLVFILALAVSILSPLAYAQREVVLYTHGWWQPPPANRFNPFAPKAIRIDGLVYERLAYWIKMTDQYVPELAIGWEVKRDQNVIIVHLRKGVYWHDGQPFTCKDVWTTLMIYKALGRDVWNYISDVECKDDYTVVYHVKKWAYLILHYVLFRDGQIVAPYHIYGKFAEEIAKATSKSELEEIVKKLVEFEPKTIIGTGPFKFQTITSHEVVLVKFDKYWAADKIMIDKIIMPYITSNQVGWQYYLTGKLDYDCFMMPYEVLKQVEAKPFAKVVKISDMSGFALVFNFNNKWLRIREVREAIAYAINRAKVATAAGKGLFDPVDYPTGLLKMQETWIEDLISAGVLNKYEYNPQKAAELLEKVGFTKKNGVWYTPDGKPFKLVLIAPGGWTDWVAAMNEVAEELKAFGIQVELRTPEAPSYWSDQWYKGGKGFDIAIDFYGVWMTYPWRAMKRVWVSVDVTPKKIIQGEEFYKWEQNLYLPYFKTSINAIDLVNKLAVTFNKSEQKDIIEKLAYAVNYYLPIYPIAEKNLVLYYNVEHFIWPDPKYNYVLWQNAAGGHLEALAFMIKLGAVVPNPKYWGLAVTTTVPVTVTIPKPVTVAKTVTVATTVATTVPVTVTGVQTVTVTKEVTKEVTVTAPPVTVTMPTTVTTTVTQTAWGPAIGIAIVLFIIGLVIGWFIKRK